MSIDTAGVVGLGTMGAGIVEVFARAGLDVIAVELDDNLLAAGRQRLERSLGKLVDRGRLEATERDATLARVTFTTDRSALAAADLVTEAVPERLDIKTQLFADLDAICPDRTILATNTSSLSVTRIAAATSRPDWVLGMHFFNPAPVMGLVEVVHTVTTGDEALAAVRVLAERCGKTPVVVGDRAGFVANALLFGYLNAAALAAERGHAAVTDIDAAMVACCGLPMGPLTLLDLIGLDVSLDVLETMFDETRDQRYAPAPLLRRMVMAGRLGRKTGSGYYRYDGATAVPAVGIEPPEATPKPVQLVAVGDADAPLISALGAKRVDIDEAKADVVVVAAGSRTATADLVSRLSRGLSPDTVLAVVTHDDAPVAAVAGPRPKAVVGLHFPLAPRPGVVEVVATRLSAPDAVASVAAAVRDAGCTPVVCRDRPGYLVESLLLPHLGDAVRMVDDGYADRDDVDVAMTAGCGYPQGPFAMLDAVGADEVRAGLLHLAAATHLPALAPAPLLDELAASAGR